MKNLKGNWVNKKSGVKWRVNYIYEEDKEVVLVKLTGKPLTKIITINSLLKNWQKN